MEDDPAHESLAQRVAEPSEVAEVVVVHVSSGLDFDCRDATVAGLELYIDLPLCFVSVMVQARAFHAPGNVALDFADHEGFEQRAGGGVARPRKLIDTEPVEVACDT